MNRILLFTFLLSFEFSVFSQTSQGIGTSTPNRYSVLDVSSINNNKGFLIPRMTTTQRTSISGLGSTEKGLQVFDTDLNANFIWDGSTWQQISFGSGFSWVLNGNSTNSSNFIGTTSNNSFRIRTNNIPRMMIDSVGYVGIGTVVPTSILDIFNAPASSIGPEIKLTSNEGSFVNTSANLTLQRSKGSSNVLGILTNGNRVGNIQFNGYDGTTFQPLASISSFTDNIPLANSMPGRLTFSTTPNGTTTLEERMRITSGGNIGIGTSSPGNSKLNVISNSTDANSSTGLTVTNAYSGTTTKYGIDINIDGAGTGSKYGISTSVIGAANASILYGYQQIISPNASGTGTVYGYFSNISNTGSGQRIGIYNILSAVSGNASNIYGIYNSIAKGGGRAFGLYTSGEDLNYFSDTVGIGTTTPKEMLHVIGNVVIPAANDYKYTSPKTNYATISGASFRTINGLTVDGNGTGNAFWISGGSTLLSESMYATIQLPNGALINTLDVYVYDNDLLYSVNAELVRFAMQSNSVTSIATTGFSLVIPGVTTVTSNGINQIVDNSTYSYYIKFNTRQNNSNLWIRGARVTYSVNNAD